MKNLPALLVMVCQLTAHAQISVPFTSDQWTFQTKDYSTGEYIGKQAVRINQNFARLKGVSFENGIIEYDVAFAPGRGFIGVSFRMQDEDNFEEFYLRPHQSGNPDANQYTPVYGGVAAWQLYYGEGYAKAIAYPFNKWIHIKLIVSGQFMEVYIDDMENPVLFSELKRPPQAGYLGLGNFRSENYFANFTYTPLPSPQLRTTPKTKASPDAGTVSEWMVSGSVSETELLPLTDLASFKPLKTEWKKAKTENTGMLNLAACSSLSEEKNTVFVRVVAYSAIDQVKKFSFGFSDRVRFFFNNKLLFTGDDAYMSRDYRFLGTAGYYDAVYLPVKKGRNEITIAVSETFGGWGIQGKFDDPSGIELKAE